METNTKQKYYRRWQKGSLLLGLLVLVATMVMGLHQQTAKAAVPYYINFQGKITKNSDGTNVADGNYAIQFKIYDAASSGNLLWTETWDATTTQVNITNGVFNVKLGTYTSLATVDFTGGSLYLTVNFNPGAGYDGEMLPRKQLVTSAFAFNASNVVGNGRIAITTTSTTQSALQVTYNPDASTSTPAAVITASSNETGPALKVVQNGTGYAGIFTGGNVGIGTSSPIASFAMVGSGAASTSPIFQVGTSTNSGILNILQNGNVGIGTVNPLSKLSSGGDGKAGAGVYGYGPTYGVFGEGTDNNYGVYGVDGHTGGVGVLGSAMLHGVEGDSGSAGGFGVYGYANGANGTGVYGAGTAYDFYAATVGGTSYFAGQVGIGTTTPPAQLSVASSSTTQPTALIIATSSQTSAILTVASSSGSSYLAVLANGNVGIGPTLP